MKAKTMLRLARESGKETVSSMANRLNIGISRYYMIETGERPASPIIAKKISEILNVPQDHIFLPQSFTARDVKQGKNTA